MAQDTKSRRGARAPTGPAESKGPYASRENALAYLKRSKRADVAAAAMHFYTAGLEAVERISGAVLTRHARNKKLKAFRANLRRLVESAHGLPEDLTGWTPPGMPGVGRLQHLVVISQVWNLVLHGRRETPELERRRVHEALSSAQATGVWGPDLPLSVARLTGRRLPSYDPSVAFIHEVRRRVAETYPSPPELHTAEWMALAVAAALEKLVEDEDGREALRQKWQKALGRAESVAAGDATNIPTHVFEYET